MITRRDFLALVGSLALGCEQRESKRIEAGANFSSGEIVPYKLEFEAIKDPRKHWQLEYNLKIFDRLTTHQERVGFSKEYYSRHGRLVNGSIKVYNSVVLYPLFEQVGLEEFVDPYLLAKLAMVESEMRPEVINPDTGARGLMQVMPFNFRRGERYRNVEHNIRAGARVFRRALDFVNDNSEKALIVYNGDWNNFIRSNQKAKEHEFVQRVLSAEIWA